MKEHTMKFLKTLPVIFILSLAVSCSCGKIPSDKFADTFSAYNIYGSNMVLQQERPILIYGTAPAGTYVKVEFAGKTVYAESNLRKEWRAEFPAMKAGGPFSMKISGKNGKTIVFDNILIGEVWICSGQSNMEMPVSSKRQFWRVKNHLEEAANANYPQIRFFNRTRKKSPFMIQPQAGGGKWEVCTPETAAPFSAAGYFFGRQIHKDLNVPVGLINVSWSGTRIEPWISESGYRFGKRIHELNMIAAAKTVAGLPQEERNKALNAKLDDLKEIFIKVEKWFESFENFDPAATKNARTWKDSSFNDSSWDNPIRSRLPEEIDGVAWFRKTVNLPAKWKGKDLTLSLGVIDDCDETFFNGTRIGETGRKIRNSWTLKRVYTIPGKLVKEGRNVIAVRISDYHGDGGFMDSGKNMFLAVKGEKSEKISLASDWKYKLEFAIDRKKIGPRPNQSAISDVNGPQFPATLFNGMIAPWTRYPVRGAIWYQGCSNAGSKDYYPLHKLLIQDWRRQWKDPDMAFILVQLAGFDKYTPENPKPDNYWVGKPFAFNVPYALTREIQAEMLNLPKVGMAVAMDVGNHSDIHPADKQTVGFRLAKEAERVAYGKTGISQGPMFKSMTVEGNRIRVKFDNVGKGLTTKDGKAPGAFAIAGKDGKFVWASAKIDGDTVLVSSPLVKEPCHVRYAWTQYRGDVNLCSKDGFAAPPFRSDKPKYE